MVVRAQNNLDLSIIKQTDLDYHYLRSPLEPEANTPGSRPRKARLEKKMTIRDLAAGIAPTNISLLEADKTKAKPFTLRRLAKVLDIPVSYLGCFESLPEDTLGQRITKARCYHGLTKKELATAIGVNEKTVGLWEKDLCKPLARYLRLINTLKY